MDTDAMKNKKNPLVKGITRKLSKRLEIGERTYKKTLDKSGLSAWDVIHHFDEEVSDMVIYWEYIMTTLSQLEDELRSVKYMARRKRIPIRIKNMTKTLREMEKITTPEELEDGERIITPNTPIRFVDKELHWKRKVHNAIIKLYDANKIITYPLIKEELQWSNDERIKIILRELDEMGRIKMLQRKERFDYYLMSREPITIGDVKRYDNIT
jgi:hypothetical protein